MKCTRSSPSCPNCARAAFLEAPTPSRTSGQRLPGSRSASRPRRTLFQSARSTPLRSSSGPPCCRSTCTCCGHPFAQTRPRLACRTCTSHPRSRSHCSRRHRPRTPIVFAACPPALASPSRTRGPRSKQAVRADPVFALARRHLRHKRSFRCTCRRSQSLEAGPVSASASSASLPSAQRAAAPGRLPAKGRTCGWCHILRAGTSARRRPSPTSCRRRTSRPVAACRTFGPRSIARRSCRRESPTSSGRRTSSPPRARRTSWCSTPPRRRDWRRPPQHTRRRRRRCCRPFRCRRSPTPTRWWSTWPWCCSTPSHRSPWTRSRPSQHRGRRRRRCCSPYRNRNSRRRSTCTGTCRRSKIHSGILLTASKGPK